MPLKYFIFDRKSINYEIQIVNKNIHCDHPLF